MLSRKLTIYVAIPNENLKKVKMAAKKNQVLEA